MHSSFVEPPDLSPHMKLTLSIDDAVSFTEMLSYLTQEISFSQKNQRN